MRLKKMVAPAVIALVLLICLGGYLLLCLLVDISVWIKVAGSVVLLLLMGVVVFVLKERMQEIRSGEEDDLGQY